jgi:hypothetical protein
MAKQPEKIVTAIVVSRPGDWVEEMHRHYQETGTYRAEDIRKVLGDPIEGVGGPPLRVHGLALVV